MSDFRIIIRAIKDAELHLIYNSAEQWAYVTDKFGKRYFITSKMSYAEALDIIEQVKTNNKRFRPI